MTDRELIEKSVKVHQLFFEVEFPPMLSQFFDLDSNELLDEIHFRERQLERLDYLRFKIQKRKGENG